MAGIFARAIPANTLRAPEAFARTLTNSCMKSNETWTQTYFIHSARASRHRREDSERLLQRRVPLNEPLGKMAWIHALGHDAPVSSPQGHPEDALSSAGQGTFSGSRTARPSRMLPRSVRILNGCHFCCRRLKIRPVFCNVSAAPVGAKQALKSPPPAICHSTACPMTCTASY